VLLSGAQQTSGSLQNTAKAICSGGCSSGARLGLKANGAFFG
jgi:hypothetical protein